MSETRSAYPLEWPAGWRRMPAGRRMNGKFSRRETQYRDGQSWSQKKDLSVTDATQRVLGELALMGIERQEVVISTNVPLRLDGLPRSGERAPDDPAVAVYWRDRAVNQPPRCMAIDRYATVADNLAAVAATLEAMRAIERHGGAEILDRAFSGFLALPETSTQPWREVLGLGAATLTRAEVLAKANALLLANNPDQGGGRDRYESIIAARKRALAEVDG